MKVIADFNLVPVSVAKDVSIPDVLLAIDDLIHKSKLEYSIQAHGVNLCGEEDQIIKLTQDCQKKAASMGVQHAAVYLRIHQRRAGLKENEGLATFMASIQGKMEKIRQQSQSQGSSQHSTH